MEKELTELLQKKYDALQETISCQHYPKTALQENALMAVRGLLTVLRGY